MHMLARLFVPGMYGETDHVPITCTKRTRQHSPDPLNQTAWVVPLLPDMPN